MEGEGIHGCTVYWRKDSHQELAERPPKYNQSLRQAIRVNSTSAVASGARLGWPQMSKVGNPHGLPRRVAHSMDGDQGQALEDTRKKHTKGSNDPSPFPTMLSSEAGREEDTQIQC